MINKSRFAPSPTGFLHIGNVRSALINWAHINNKNGEFFLRIDDTDSERSKVEFINAIEEDLKWLGIKWQKSFRQSERISLYNSKVDILKKSKRLYPCFETQEELALKRKNQLSLGNPPIYDRSSVSLTKEKIKSLIDSGKKPHWRLKLEDKIIEWNDLIKGKVSFDSKNLSDPILIREDGSFLYHLPSVADDIEEGITDIIRGEDHISNTAFHIQIFEALNADVPKFGHHPFLTDDKGKGLGKRLGSLSIRNLKEDGFENITIINYLLKIGTSQNLTKIKELKNVRDSFDINTLAASSPKFSIDSLKLLNKDILKSYNFSEVKNKFLDLDIKDVTEDFWNFVKNNINFFSETKFWWHIVNSDEIYEIKDKEYLHIAANLLPLDPFTTKSWEEWTENINKKTGKKGKELFMPLRIALTGLEKGPELKYLMPLLDRKKIVRKLGL